MVRASHICARAGLVGVVIDSALVVLLVFDVVVSLTAGLVAALGVLVVFVSVWAGLPLLSMRDRSDGPV